MTDDEDNHDFSEPDPATDDDSLDGFFGDENDAATDGGEDDPWASVKSEDELKQTTPTTDDTDDETGDEEPFHERLSDALQSNGWTLSPFADATGYGVTEMADIISGETTPGEETREELLATARDGPSSAGATTEAPDQNHQTESSPDVPDRPDASDLDWANMDAIDGEFMPDGVSCENCAHREVCVVLNSFVPMLRDENWDAGTEEDGSPIDPMDMAKICSKYDPEDDAPAKEAAAHE